MSPHYVVKLNDIKQHILKSIISIFFLTAKTSPCVTVLGMFIYLFIMTHYASVTDGQRDTCRIFAVRPCIMTVGIPLHSKKAVMPNSVKNTFITCCVTQF